MHVGGGGAGGRPTLQGSLYARGRIFAPFHLITPAPSFDVVSISGWAVFPPCAAGPPRAPIYFGEMTRSGNYNCATARTLRFRPFVVVFMLFYVSNLAIASNFLYVVPNGGSFPL